MYIEPNAFFFQRTNLFDILKNYTFLVSKSKFIYGPLRLPYNTLKGSFQFVNPFLWNIIFKEIITRLMK